MMSTDLSNSSSSLNSSLGLQSLLDEPQRLSLEALRLNSELETLVMDNYKIFIENLTCSVHLRSEDKKLGEISVELESNLHDLTQQCLTFKEKVSQFVGSHKRNRKTLQHHMQLVELLEVPQLVDACARNGLYDEALELAHFVNGLERRHLLAAEVNSSGTSTGAAAALQHHHTVFPSKGGSGVIQTIVDDVHLTLAGLRQQLLHQLTDSATLSRGISILATLRKLDGLLIDRHLSISLESSSSSTQSGSTAAPSQHSYRDKAGNALTTQQYREQLRQYFSQNSEIRLQMDFLEARSLWLHRIAERPLSTAAASGLNALPSVGAIASADGDEAVGSKGTLGPYGKIIELLEVRRTAWFTVITQFNALFRDQEAGHRAATTATASEYNRSRGSTEPFTAASFSPVVVLNSWVTRQVNQLLREMQLLLLPNSNDGATLRSILEQTLFFSTRMSQVGCDFSNLVLPLFKEVVMTTVKRELAVAVEQFKVMLLTERISFESSGLTTLSKEQLIPVYSPQEHSGAVVTEASPSSAPASGHRNTVELAAPVLLLRFPPLAFLLNSFLSQINYLRECPIVTLEQPAADLLFAVFADVSAYIVEKKADIRRLGGKYFTGGVGGVLKDLPSQSTGHHRRRREDALDSSAATADSGSSGEASMDQLYGRVVALELMPHVLFCFDTIFNPNTVKVESRMKLLESRTAQKSAGPPSLQYLVRNLWEARDFLDADVVDQLECVWGGLVRGGLVEGSVLRREAPGLLMSTVVEVEGVVEAPPPRDAVDPSDVPPTYEPSDPLVDAVVVADSPIDSDII